MKIRNKARFWTGAVMGLFELLGLGIYGLTLIDWSWLTERKVILGLGILAIVLYNVLTITLIISGSKEK